ncbi:leucine-rich repeat-containing protein 31 [Ambystoma mexicanum]|uniref:leucine-rich repeat-containing protein 31 n=1 Tax=Ambystoma mexicanum TaxID=8296 RepID=UPI0037E8DB51
MEKREIREDAEKKRDEGFLKRSPFDLLFNQIQRKKSTADKRDPSSVSRFFRGREADKPKTEEKKENKENKENVSPPDDGKKDGNDDTSTAEEHQNPMLDVSGWEKVKQFMEKFDKKPNINCMNLNNCGLTAIDIMELVALLPFLPELEEFDVSWNDFIGGAFKPVTIELHYIGKLRILKINNCRLTSDDIEALGESLEYIPNLEELDLSWNGNLGGNLQRLTSNFQRNCKMKVLKLRDCNLTSDDGNSLATALKLMNSLETIDVSMNTSIGCSLRSIAQELKNIPCLRSLKLQMCGLTHDSMQCLSAAFQCLPELRKLDLSCNKAIGGGFQSSAADLSTLKQLRVLDIHKCGLTEEDMATLTQVIPLLSSLEALNLSSNRNIGSSSEHLFSRFRFLPKLKSVMLSHSALTGRSFAELAEALFHLSELEQLDLSWNKCVGGQLTQLLDMLKRAAVLRELRLSSCDLVAQDVAVLASLAQAGHLGKLQKLDLSYNSTISDDAWNGFFQSLDALKELTELDFSLKPSTSRECGVWLSSLLANVKKMAKLTELGMQRWVFSAAQQAQLESFRKDNKRNIEID